MRKIGWQLAIAIGGLLLVLGLLLGQTPDPEAARVQPVQGGAYAEALVGSWARLNPLLDRGNQIDRDIDRLLYGALIRFDSFGEPAPELAESFSISADATLYNFTIHPEAVWHDGQPVTADDVIFTFSKFKEPDYPGPSDLTAFWQEVEIVKLDEKNVQFQLPDRFSPFLDYLAVGLLPDHLLRGVSAGELIDHPFNREPIGSGPFKFEAFLQDEDGEVTGVSLTAFEGYVRGRPFLERIEFRFFDDPQAAIQAYLDGEVDGIGSVSPEILSAVLAESNLNLHSTRNPSTVAVLINTGSSQREYLGDKQLRQALLLAINRDWIIGSLLDGQGIVAAGPILPGTWAYASNLDPLPFDPALAGEKLSELGWELPAGAVAGTEEYVRTDGERSLRIELAYAEPSKFEELAQVLQASWEDLGIQVELRSVEQDQLVEALLAPRDFDAVLVEVDYTSAPDPDPYTFWHDSQAETGQNYSAFRDRNISIWLEQARVTPDRERRSELYRDFQFRFRDQAPALMLYHPVFSYAISSEVQGASLGPIFDPSDRFGNIVEWFLLVRRGFEG
jgi:peptide/nickel transport system substrate-binding protein